MYCQLQLSTKKKKKKTLRILKYLKRRLKSSKKKFMKSSWRRSWGTISSPKMRMIVMRMTCLSVLLWEIMIPTDRSLSILPISQLFRKKPTRRMQLKKKTQKRRASQRKVKARRRNLPRAKRSRRRLAQGILVKRRRRRKRKRRSHRKRADRDRSADQAAQRPAPEHPDRKAAPDQANRKAASGRQKADRDQIVDQTLEKMKIPKRRKRDAQNDQYLWMRWNWVLLLRMTWDLKQWQN
mmetsp:Transcript_2281/g.5204  ORF Transcript_2281/g.5204 Transcript_2281/m.5204 type:complete len:238 (+) Transcript_2281:290-1003(+)